MVILGALSQRRVNPVDPQYDEIGTGLRQDYAYAEKGKENPVKKTCNRMKPEWKKSTVIPIIEDKKVMKSDAPSDPLIAAANVNKILFAKH